MTRRLPVLLLCLALLSGAPDAAAEDPPVQVDPEVHVSAEQRDDAIRKALPYLDESLWKLNEHGSSRKPYAAAIAGWAYLIAADRVKEGRKIPSRSKQLQRIRDYLTRYVEEVARAYERDDDKRKKDARRKPKPGMPPGMPGGMRGMMGPKQYTWSLGQIACFLAESIERKKARSASKKLLRKVVFVLEASQQENGGWGHDDASRPGLGLPPIRIPKPGGGQLTYPGTLLGASNCALAGLGSAYRALGTKPSEAVGKARGYFRASQNGDGTFPYDPGQVRKTGPTTGPRGMPGAMGAIGLARTSGSVYALLAAGESPAAESITRALAAVDAKPAWFAEGHGSASMAFQYGGLLAAARGGKAWASFRKIYFPRILAAQNEDGSFDCAALGVSPGVTNDTKELPGMKMPGWTDQARPYVTAIHVLLLMLDRAPSRSAPPVPGDASGKAVTPR